MVMATTSKARRTTEHTNGVFPVLVVVVDKNMAVKELNGAARQFLGPQYKNVLRKRHGEAFACVHHQEAEAGCGHGRFCRVCPVREAATLAHREQRVVRRHTKAEVGTGDQKHEVILLVTATPLPSKGSARILLMLEDVTALAALQMSAPICASCKRVREDRAYWEQLTAHLSEQLDLDLNGGICADCRKQLYGSFKGSQALFFKERTSVPRDR
jgi:hypothetical protein